jgi:hypothetical protein
MHYILRTTLLISAFCLSALSFSQAQNRVKSGIIYQPGDTILAPLFGIEAQVPVNWYGLLPQDSEVFLLTSNQDDDSRVYVRASENSYDKLQQAWKEGLVLTENLKVVVNGPINYRGEIMYADVDIVVNGKLPRNYKAYVEAKCGDYGKCVSFFLLAGEKIFEGLKKETMELADKTKLIEPGMAKIYENFDWQKLLTGKYLMSYDQENYKNNRNTNEIWLHEDGTFKSDVERKGLIDEERGEYWGKNKGTWKVEGKGQEAKLILSFHKHDPLQLDLLIEEDKIYLNEQRYFVMYDR